MTNEFHLVLYRKYRPQNFSEVIGQPHITEPLKKAVSLGKIGHSYLFSGPKGTGKTSMARILAKAANCETRGLAHEPCNKCVSCEEIILGNSLDLVELDAASNRGIDEIRALREAVRLNPFKSKYRIYIIDEVHMLTKEAFNALLKTLEEPPRHTIFILATTEREKIPETILSRCEQYNFKKMSEELTRLSLKTILEKEKIKIGDWALSALSILADGSLRDAHSKLEQVLNFEKKEISDDEVREFFGVPKENLVLEFIEAIILKNTEKTMEISRTVSEKAHDQKLFIKLILRNLRFIMLSLLSPATERDIMTRTSKKELAFIKEIKQKTNVPEIENLLKIFLDAYMSPLHFHFPELPLEMALAEIFKKK